VRKAKHLLLAGYSGSKDPAKKARVALDDITFTEDDVHDMHWPHNDALVIRVLKYEESWWIQGAR